MAEGGCSSDCRRAGGGASGGRACRSGRLGQTVSVLVSVLIAAIAVAAWPASVGADESVGEVTQRVEIDGQETEGAGSSDPVKLSDQPRAALRIEIENGTDGTIDADRVRLEGTALGVTFLAYDTVLAVEVDPGATETIDYDLPLNDLADQAIGLIPASVALLDVNGDEIATQRFTLDVDGSPTSVFGLFGWFISGVTVLTLLLNLWLVVRRRLPTNRFLRGIRFALPGFGIGLTLAIALGAFGIFAPYPATWPPLVVVPAAGAFLLGYISPGPLSLDDDEVDRALASATQPSTTVDRG